MLVLLLLIGTLMDAAYCNLSADEFLEKVIHEPLEKELKALNLDPAPLPDFGLQIFEYGLGGLLTLTGRVDFSNGIFNGLSKIQRLLQCQGPDLDLSDIKIECELRFPGLNAVYDGVAKVQDLPLLPFQITAYINETRVRSSISGIPATFKGQLKLFEITKFGDINVRLSNLGILQSVYNAVEERFRERVRKEAMRMILEEFPLALRAALILVKLPGLT